MGNSLFRFSCACGDQRCDVMAIDAADAARHIHAQANTLPVCNNCHDLARHQYSEPPLPTFTYYCQCKRLMTSVNAQDRAAANSAVWDKVATLPVCDRCHHRPVLTLAEVLNAAPPADAKEWTCTHGWDALWCTHCADENMLRNIETSIGCYDGRFEDGRLNSATAAWDAFCKNEPPPAPAPRRRAMRLTGEIPT